MISEQHHFLELNNITKYSHQAMNTIFELFIAGEAEEYAKQAAFEAFNEIDKLEQELSRFKPNSEITRINNLKSGESLIISEDAMNCLLQSIQMYNLTDHTFDITLGKVIELCKAEKKVIEEINSGFNNLIIDENNFRITITNPVSIDLGGIGKGYAADKIAELLKEWEVQNFLISSGSTIKLNSGSEHLLNWPITLTNPINDAVIANLGISSGSLSASGIKKGNHIVNPNKLNSGSTNRQSSWVYCENAAVSDSLSTAFMLLGIQQIKKICESDHTISCLIIDGEIDNFELVKFGDFFDSV